MDLLATLGIAGEDRKRMSVVRVPRMRQPSASVVQPPVISVDDKTSDEDEKEKELAKR